MRLMYWNWIYIPLQHIKKSLCIATFVYQSSTVPTWQSKKYPDNARKIKQVQPVYNIIQRNEQIVLL